jgi:hypothetical protein
MTDQLENNGPYQDALSAEEIERQVMSSTFPKTSMEWWARGEIEKLRARIAEQDYVLEMKWRAEDRAIKAWQEKTGEHLTWPDQAKLVEWLMDELHAARAALNGEQDV